MLKKWLVLPPPPQEFFDAHPELPKIVSHLLYHRGLRTQKQIDEFLNPDYSEDIHDPFLFRDMKKAVERIFSAMEKGERITIYGDYDADGVSGATILTDGLRALGCLNFSVFLPHRETDGYGVSMRAVDTLKQEGTSLMITCDCGGSNTKEIAYANELGIDVIVTDHHTLPEQLPPAFAMIHPKAPGETYPDQTLAGGGVAFKLLQALLKTHKETNAILPNGERHEALEKWSLDMAAIASVADMVPLLGESRTLTKYGLIVLNKTRRIGLQKLLLEARLMEQDGALKKEISADTIAFQLAPRINAAGRMNHASVAYNLMVTKDPLEATDLAFELNKNNQDRQRLSEELSKEAITQVAGQTETILFAMGNGWPIGLVGLIAGKLKEKFQKPAIVMTTHGSEITGSGRSINAFNMIAAFQAIPECFVKFGGHPMACGFTVATPEKMEEFKQKLGQEFARQTEGTDVFPALSIDAEVALDDVTWELYDVLEKFSPFGQANPKPRYAGFGLTVVSLKSLGKDKRHLSLFAKHASKIKKFIGWNLCNSSEEGCIDWSKAITTGDKVDIVFEISVNEWNGNRELQLTIVDIRKNSSLTPIP